MNYAGVPPGVPKIDTDVSQVPGCQLVAQFRESLQALGLYVELIERRAAQGRYGEIGRYTSLTKLALERTAALSDRLLGAGNEG